MSYAKDRPAYDFVLFNTHVTSVVVAVLGGSCVGFVVPSYLYCEWGGGWLWLITNSFIL